MKTSLIIFVFWIAGILWGSLLHAGIIPIVVNVLISFGIGYGIGEIGHRLEEGRQ